MYSSHQQRIQYLVEFTLPCDVEEEGEEGEGEGEEGEGEGGREVEKGKDNGESEDERETSGDLVSVPEGELCDS